MEFTLKEEIKISLQNYYAQQKKPPQVEEGIEWVKQQFQLDASEERLLFYLVQGAFAKAAQNTSDLAEKQCISSPPTRVAEGILFAGPGEDPPDLHAAPHQTAVLGAFGTGSEQSFLGHEDCILVIQNTQGFHLITLIGNEGFTPCTGCGLPLAGPSRLEVFELGIPLLPIPSNIAEVFYPQVWKRQTNVESPKRKKVHPDQLPLF